MLYIATSTVGDPKCAMLTNPTVDQAYLSGSREAVKMRRVSVSVDFISKTTIAAHPDMGAWSKVWSRPFLVPLGTERENGTARGRRLRISWIYP